jgi:hypothetical protein
MGQYRLAFYFEWQIGFLISYDNDLSMVGINLPFIEITIATSKDAYGIRFFKD